jgi:nicotinate-nucleotide--dimethylbenzimidazole phosphoribosyltransferase
MNHRITFPSEPIRTLALEKLDNKTKPPGSLGKLEALAAQMAAVQERLDPVIEQPAVFVFAGDHGISREPISAYPREVTRQMVLNFAAGGAAINVLCRLHQVQLTVVDAGVDGDLPHNAGILSMSLGRGTRNFLHEPAMTDTELRAALARGGELMERAKAAGTNTIGFGEMGIGNTSSAAILTHRYTGRSLDECTGRGTGLNDEQLKRKKQILFAANKAHSPGSPFEILRTFGGFEIAMMTGAMLRAAELRMILLVDGFISTAAMLAAFCICPEILGYAVFCHRSAETGHRHALEFLKADPILDLGMRLGEGTGCALAVPVLRSAAAILSEMASFESASVSRELQ